MFLRAGILSLVLLLASRLLGLARESVQAAAFGATGLGDVAVLMLTLPDWVAGVLATGGLAYVLLPAWAKQGDAEGAASQRRVARGVLLAGRAPAAGWGPPPALPPALLAALWTPRLQHEGDFGGLYGANLVVNLSVIAALW